MQTAQKLEEEFELDDTQLEAIERCCNMSERIVAVTGAAGTGKTTILQNVYRRLYKQGRTVVLCAPTGKAAKRITEATGIQACTIHRLLEYPFPGERDPETGKTLVSTDPKRDRNCPVEEKVILVDEYAMVSVEVHRNLLDAIPSGGVIRVFGDANQLQPIESNKRIQAEPSSFLKMLDKFDGIRLESIHRQAAGSSIITNGQKIIKGAMPVRKDDFEIKITKEPVQVVLDYIQENLTQEIDYGSITNQIISPTKVGWVGTEALNASIQQLLQPRSAPYKVIQRHKWSKIEEQRLYVGDKVIFTVNNYGLLLFNGETGIVTKFKDDGGIVIDFGDKDIEVPESMEMQSRYGIYYTNPQKDLDLAYVITTHKAQGSEYDRVCYVMNSSRGYLLNRKNLYTAVTRAREHVAVITDAKSINLSLYRKGDK